MGKRGPKKTKIPTDIIRKYARAHLTLAEAAAKAGVSMSTLSTAARPFIKAHGIDRWKLAFRSKVNVTEAQALYAAGWTLEALGDRYGVTRERVRQKINTDVVVHSRPHDRTCTKCGRVFQGRKYTILCEACKPRKEYDRCACGKIKRKELPACGSCQTRKFPHSLVPKLYRLGFAGVDIARAFRVHPAAVYRALRHAGTPRRSKTIQEATAKLARQKQSISDVILELTKSSL